MSEREKPKPCYREVTNGVHFVKAEHRHDCVEVDCRGCVVCAERHCTAKRNCCWHIDAADLTCGRCIAEARRELRWIGDLAALMMTQAMSDGVESEAANLAGPAADPEAWSWRKVAARQGVAWHVSLIEDDDEHHPSTVVGTWQRMIAEDYNHEPLANLAAQVAYLDRHLHRIANDDTQDFPLMRRELRKCRQHLEAVLHNDTRPDQGAPCPTCVEQTGKGAPLRREYAHWCDDADCERFHLTDDASDVWRCARNRDHWWTAQGYAEVVREMWEDAERERMGA